MPGLNVPDGRFERAALGQNPSRIRSVEHHLEPLSGRSGDRAVPLWPPRRGKVGSPHGTPPAPHPQSQSRSNGAFNLIINWSGYRDLASAYREATGLPLACVPAAAGAGCVLNSGVKENKLCRFLLRNPRSQAACRKFAEQLGETAASGRRMCSVKCFAGLLEIGVPVFSVGRHVATLTTGRVFHDRRGPSRWSRIENLLGPITSEELERGEKAYWSVPVVPRKQVEASGCLLQLIAKSLAEHITAYGQDSSPDTTPSIARALDYIRGSTAEPLNLPDVARHAGLSPQHFCKVFKQSVGLTFTHYLAALRVEHAKSLLANNSRRIAEIAFDCGFGSVPTFNRLFKRLTGRSPITYKSEVLRREPEELRRHRASRC